MGILDLGDIDVGTNQDTWIMRLPKEVCAREGLADGTLISLTVKDGGIQTKFISPPSEKLRGISKKILEDDKELHQRLKEIGD